MQDIPLKRQQIIKTFQDLPGSSNNILVSQKGNRLYIAYNRPARYNAFTTDMYVKLTKAINEASSNPEVKYIVITGNGANFSSGNDLQNFIISAKTNIPPKEMARIMADIIYELTESIISCQKPIFAITEGKSIGFAFTQLLLYDRVWVVEGSQFNAPLVKLAQGPQMCSAYTFPKRFGQQEGEDLIVSGKKVNPTYLEKYGIAKTVKSRAEGEQQLEQYLTELDTLQWSSFLNTRKLFRDIDRQILKKVNKAECDNLCSRWSSPDLVPFLMDYMNKLKTKPKL